MFSKIFPVLLPCRARAIACSFSDSKKKALYRITDERLCSTEGAVAPSSFKSNRRARTTAGKTLSFETV
jgi:hypothetical protein